MKEVLLTAGVASIILAVVGGGASAFGVQIPVLDKAIRQIALGVVGVLFLLGAFVVPNGDGAGGDDGEVTAYRQEVLATCESLQASGSNPFFEAANQDGTFDRARLMDGLRNQLQGSKDVLEDLWTAPVPTALAEEARAARQAGERLLARTTRAINEIPSRVPPTFSTQELFTLAGHLNASLRAPSSRFERAMARLAGQPCRLPENAPSE